MKKGRHKRKRQPSRARRKLPPKTRRNFIRALRNQERAMQEKLALAKLALKVNKTKENQEAVDFHQMNLIEHQEILGEALAPPKPMPSQIREPTKVVI